MRLLPDRRPPIPVLLIWAWLGFDFTVAMYELRWSLAFIAAVTFALTLVPLVVSRRIGIKLPVAFVVWSTLFIFATIFLGEAFDFYHRYWWWDIALHGMSALGFGMIGFVMAYILFEGENYSAPPWALALFGFTIAMTIGAIWEIFEFLMDFQFGTNMQKSGLVDTMTDLMVDMLGGAVGAVGGFVYLKTQGSRAFARRLERYIENRRLRLRRRP